jgi:carboxymethylenebutenolidase
VPGAVLDASAIRTELLTFPGADGVQVNGYLARPAAEGSYPAMVVIHSAGGLSEHNQDVTRRFANLGYLALCPDLFTREDGPPPTGDLPAMMARLFAMRDATVLGDLEGAAELLQARSEATGKLGCIGFCMGGRYALLLACSSDRLDAAVDCWGGFIHSATPEQRSTPARPTPPLELAEQVRCPLMAAIGAEDNNPSPEIGARLRDALARSAQDTRVDVYEGAGHAFFADDRPSYRPEQATTLWDRVVPFFDTNLS